VTKEFVQVSIQKPFEEPCNSKDNRGDSLTEGVKFSL